MITLKGVKCTILSYFRDGMMRIRRNQKMKKSDQMSIISFENESTNSKKDRYFTEIEFQNFKEKTQQKFSEIDKILSKVMKTHPETKKELLGASEICQK